MMPTGTDGFVIDDFRQRNALMKSSSPMTVQEVLLDLLRSRPAKFVQLSLVDNALGSDLDFLLQGFLSNLACADLADDVPIPALSAPFDRGPKR